jgi:hypothetical protein
MKKYLEKLQTRLIMWSPEKKSHVRFRSFGIRFIDHFLYPEFRDERFTRRLKAVFYTPLVVTSFIVLMGVIASDSKLMAATYRLIGITSDSTINDIEADAELLRNSLYEESGIAIPETVPYEHLKLMYNRCQEKEIPLGIFFRLVYFESRYDSTATSGVGASGYCQVMPKTFNAWYKKLGLTGGRTAENNIIVSTELLHNLELEFKRFDERKKWELVLASYNAGIGRVIDAGNNVPNITETKNYINNILSEVEL